MVLYTRVWASRSPPIAILATMIYAGQTQNSVVDKVDFSSRFGSPKMQRTPVVGLHHMFPNLLKNVAFD